MMLRPFWLKSLASLKSRMVIVRSWQSFVDIQKLTTQLIVQASWLQKSPINPILSQAQSNLWAD
jgi:hypothetical protein